MAYLRLGHIKEAAGSNMSAGLKNCIDYIFNPLKTENKSLVGGYNLDLFVTGLDVNKVAYDSMIATKIANDKLDGRQGYHYKLSFPENEDITPELAMKITNEFCAECFGNYECAYAVHTNTKHLHSHIVFNSVGLFDGYKYQYKNGDWAKIIQPAANRICEKYGLSSLELNLDVDFKLKHKCKDYGSWIKDNKKKRYSSFINNGGKYTKADIISDIDDCINISNDWDSFITNMQERGHKIDDTGKYLKILSPGRKKWCRTYTLSDDREYYSKKSIINRINGVYSMDYKAIKEKMFSDWNEYLSVIVVKPRKKLSLDFLQKQEELNLLQKNSISSMEDLLFYKEYLNQVDKMLNIYRKKLNLNLASKQKYIDAFDYINRYSKQIRAFYNGDMRNKEIYDTAVHKIRCIIDGGYEPIKLYGYINDCNKAVKMIDNYKKHIFVERKISERIEKNKIENQKNQKALL